MPNLNARLERLEHSAAPRAGFHPTAAMWQRAESELQAWWERQRAALPAAPDSRLPGLPMPADVSAMIAAARARWTA